MKLLRVTTTLAVTVCTALNLSTVQSVAADVAIHGVIDGGIASVSGGDGDEKALQVIDNGTKKSRFGFFIDQPLDNGIVAQGVLEHTIDFDDEKRKQRKGAPFDRKALVALTHGKLGTVTIGRDETLTFPNRDLRTTALEGDMVSTLGSGATAHHRLQGSVKYTTPTVGKFQANFQYGSAEATATGGTNTFQGLSISRLDELSEVNFAYGETHLSGNDGTFEHYSVLGKLNVPESEHVRPFTVIARYFNAKYLDREQDAAILNLETQKGPYKFKAQVGCSMMTGKSKVAGFRKGDNACQFGLGSEYHLIQDKSFFAVRYAKLVNAGDASQKMAGVSGRELDGFFVSMTNYF